MDEGIEPEQGGSLKNWEPLAIPEQSESAEVTPERNQKPSPVPELTPEENMLDELLALFQSPFGGETANSNGTIKGWEPLPSEKPQRQFSPYDSGSIGPPSSTWKRLLKDLNTKEN